MLLELLLNYTISLLQYKVVKKLIEGCTPKTLYDRYGKEPVTHFASNFRYWDFHSLADSDYSVYGN